MIEVSKKGLLEAFEVDLINHLVEADANYHPNMTTLEIRLYDARVQTLERMQKAIRNAKGR